MSAITDLQALVRERATLADLERDLLPRRVLPPCCYCGTTTFDHFEWCAAPWIKGEK